jgi:hypothetical protein
MIPVTLRITAKMGRRRGIIIPSSAAVHPAAGRIKTAKRFRLQSAGQPPPSEILPWQWKSWEDSSYCHCPATAHERPVCRLET